MLPPPPRCGVVVGLPLGLVVGRLVWRLVSDGLGLDLALTTPVAFIALALPDAVLAGNLLAAIPTRVAARVNPAVALRAD